MPQCRICKKQIDEKYDDYVNPSNLEYFHKGCYKDWQEHKNDITAKRSEDFWLWSLQNYLYRELQMPDLDFKKFMSQWKNLQKQKFTPKGIYMTVRYIYFVKHQNPDKALGGIGIVNKENYQEATEYWQNLYQKQQAFQGKKEAKKIIIQRPRVERKQKIYDLNDIEEWGHGR